MSGNCWVCLCVITAWRGRISVAGWAGEHFGAGDVQCWTCCLLQGGLVCVPSTGWEFSTAQWSCEETQELGSAGWRFHQCKGAGIPADLEEEVVHPRANSLELCVLWKITNAGHGKENLWILDFFRSLSRGQEKNNLKAMFSYKLTSKPLACCVCSEQCQEDLPFPFCTLLQKKYFSPTRFQMLQNPPKALCSCQGMGIQHIAEKAEHVEGQEWYWPVWLRKILQELPPVFNLMHFLGLNLNSF